MSEPVKRRFPIERRNFSVERRKYSFSVYALCPVCGCEVRVGMWHVSYRGMYDETVKTVLDQLEGMWESDKKGYTEKCPSRSSHINFF